MEVGREGGKERDTGKKEGWMVKERQNVSLWTPFMNVVHSQFCDEEIQHQYFELSTLRMKLTITPAMKRIVERVKVQPISLALLVVTT